jgi:Rieske Fe-S protein
MGEFLTEQANTLSQYADWVRGGDVESVAEIAAGEGALVRDDGKLVAVYRARDGGLQAVSAACTHMGCAVHWNSAEKSWDCPCHGSRFSPSGEVLHGPAPRSLAPFNLSDDGEAPRARASGEERRP